MFLLVACGGGEPEAVLYTRAAQAPDLVTAVALCERIDDEGTRGDCTVAAMVRAGQYEACDTIDHAAWRSECHFRRSESMALAGRWTDALATCRTTLFADNCDTHVLQFAADATSGRPREDAVAALGELRPLLGSKFAEVDFWRMWVRRRIQLGKAPDPEACPDTHCRIATRHEIEAAATEYFRHQGCEAPAPAWVAGSEDAGRWAARVHTRECKDPG